MKSFYMHITVVHLDSSPATEVYLVPVEDERLCFADALRNWKQFAEAYVAGVKELAPEDEPECDLEAFLKRNGKPDDAYLALVEEKGVPKYNAKDHSAYGSLLMIVLSELTIKPIDIVDLELPQPQEEPRRARLH